MVQFDGLRPARLKVGIISAGRVGTALGVALERADHVVVACSAISHASRQRAAASATRHPGAARPHDVAASAELLMLAVPDSRTRRPGLRPGRHVGGAARAPSSRTRPAPTASRSSAPLADRTAYRWPSTPR